MWLSTDAHPQGKDLYDAVLLAERYVIDTDLLFRALTDDYRDGQCLGLGHAYFGPQLPQRWHFDWHWFETEYPNIEGTEESWKARLTAALERSFG